MGKLGITYNDLSLLSIDELIKIDEGKDGILKQYWDQARMVSYWSFKGHAKKNFKPTDVVKFAWEKQDTIDTEKIVKIQANAGKLRELMKKGMIKFNA